jgi:hypothetical protein
MIALPPAGQLLIFNALHETVQEYPMPPPVTLLDRLITGAVLPLQISSGFAGLVNTTAGVGFTVTTKLSSMPVHPLLTGVIPNKTFSGLFERFVKACEICVAVLPDADDGIILAGVTASADQLKVVLFAVPGIVETRSMTAAELLQTVNGEACCATASGTGFTVTSKKENWAPSPQFMFQPFTRTWPLVAPAAKSMVADVPVGLGGLKVAPVPVYSQV